MKAKNLVEGGGEEEEEDEASNCVSMVEEYEYDAIFGYVMES